MIKQKKAIGLPSRDDILAFVAREKALPGAQNGGKIGKREIAKAFGIIGDQRIILKHLLKEMEADGALEKRNRGLTKANSLPPVVLADIKGRDDDGELYAFPAEWDEAAGKRPKIDVHIPRKLKVEGPVAGVGDRVLLRVEVNHTPERGQAAYSGRVIKILPKARVQVLGIYRADVGKGGRLLPVDKRSRGLEYIIAEGDEGDAQDGDLVAVDTARATRMGPPRAVVREVLGSIKSERAVSLIAIHTHNIPNVFSVNALKAAEAAKPATLAGREDWRHIQLLTIDPPDAKDHDDAVFAEVDPEVEGGFIVTVAIADVSAYVRSGSALDREALERGNSVYFPDRVVPMLPERISNDLCSLKGGEDRPALAVRMFLGPDGRKTKHSFHRIMMKSAGKLAYAQVQRAIDGAPDEATLPLMDELKVLYAAYNCAKKARDARQPLELDLPERKLILNPDGTVARVSIPERLDAHKLIEEFMILANVAAAETLEAKSSKLIYRAHDEPSLEKLNALSEFLASIGIKLAKGQVLKPEQFNQILERVKSTDNEHLVNEVVLRSQAQAEYTTQNYGHFGLNLRRYAHFTSPIRRYADLIVHRALIRALNLGDDGLSDSEIIVLPDVAAQISIAERRAMAAERETTDRLIAQFLSDKVGTIFSGRIAGVTRVGLFVKLDDTGADGFIPAATLGADYFRYDEISHELVGTRTGETHRLGDRVEVKLVEAAPMAGALRFELLSEGRSSKPMSSGKKAKGHRDHSPTGVVRQFGPKGRSSRKRGR